MGKLTKQGYNEIRNWIYRNARHIELTLWRYYFEEGSKESVLKALSEYQNEDGGFAHAIEADNWNPKSTPFETYEAISILRGIDYKDAQHPLMQGIIRYLESGDGSDESMWFFTVPSNDDYPHAPWWTYNEEENKTQSIGLTLGLSTFILENVSKTSTLYKRADAAVDSILRMLDGEKDFGEMGATCFCWLLEYLKDPKNQRTEDVNRYEDKIIKLINKRIERDLDQWIYYRPRPSEFIKRPDSIFYPGNEEIVQKELEYLVNTRPEGNVWGLTWAWFDNYEKYPKEYAISENWWKASKAIEKMRFLKAFHWIEE